MTGTSPAVVAASRLGLTFQTNDGPVQALSNVDLTIGKGEFVSFIGPSGCGKTTLLRVIADLEKPTSGTISVNGMTPEQAREKRAYGYVFQAAALFPWRTIERNVGLPLEIMGLSKAEQAERIKRTLDLVNLSGFEKKYPWQLSGGMQQRAALCRALVHDPKILLMDEPFGALDAMTRERMNVELQRIQHETGKTVILITHSIPEAVFLADRVMVMSERPGTIAATYEVPLPRPRTLDVMGDPVFIQLTQTIRKHFAAQGHLD